MSSLLDGRHFWSCTRNDVLWSLLTMSAVSGHNNFGQGVEWKLHAIFHSVSESSTLFLLSGVKVPGDESSMKQKFQGAKVPGNESSTHGTFAPRSESTWEQKFQLPVMISDRDRVGNRDKLHLRQWWVQTVITHSTAAMAALAKFSISQFP